MSNQRFEVSRPAVNPSYLSRQTVRGAVRRIGCGLFLALCLAQVGVMTEVRGQSSSAGIRPFGETIPIAALAGLYVGPLLQSDDGRSEIRNYIRIYADGTVLNVCSGRSVEEAARFLRKGGPSPILAGRLQFSSGSLDFITADEVVSVHFHGEVRGDTLVLSWKSTSRNATGDGDVYRLLPGL